MKFDSAVLCGPGKVRRRNEDNFYLGGCIRKKETEQVLVSGKRTLLAAVADGMGGEAHGDIASMLTVKTLKKEKPFTMEAMQQSLLKANTLMCREMMLCHQRMGATAVLLALNGTDGTARMMNLGDSRCYILRNNVLHQLSTDHSLVQRMVSMGQLTKQEARRHPERHKVTQHLGLFPNELILEPACINLWLKPNDRFLLCSDGLTDMVEDEVLGQTLCAGSNPQETSNSLFDLAMDNGGRDNITVMTIFVTEN